MGEGAGGGSAEEYTSDSWRPGGANSSRADREINRARDALASSNATAANVAQMNNAVPDVKPGGMFSFFSPKVDQSASPGPYYDPSGLSAPMGSGPSNFAQGLETLLGGGGERRQWDRSPGDPRPSNEEVAVRTSNFQPDTGTNWRMTPERRFAPMTDEFTRPSTMLRPGDFPSSDKPTYMQVEEFLGGDYDRPIQDTVDFLGGDLTGPSSDAMARERRADYMLPLQQAPAFPPDAPQFVGGQDTRSESLDAVGTDFFGEGPLGPLGPPPSEAERMAMERRADYMSPLQKEAMAKKVSDLDRGKTKAETPEDKSLLGKWRAFAKNPGATILGFIDKILAGGAGGPGGGADLIPFTQDTSGRLFPVSGGPGPYVGGGVHSPSGVGGAPSPIQCPPGFKFDPVMNVCVPIVAPAPTDPVTTTPAPGTTAPATGGISNIPNVYPFTLTPPIGAPVGNLPPVRS